MSLKNLIWVFYVNFYVDMRIERSDTCEDFSVALNFSLDSQQLMIDDNNSRHNFTSETAPPDLSVFQQHNV